MAIATAVAAIFVDVLEAGAGYEAAATLGVEMAETATVEGEVFYETGAIGSEAVNIGDFTSAQASANAQLSAWGIDGAMQTRLATGARGVLDNKLQMSLLQAGEIGAFHDMGGFHALSNGTLGQNQLARPFGVIPGSGPRKRAGAGGEPAPKRPRGGGGGNPKRPAEPPGGGTPKKPRGPGGGGAGGGGGGGGRPSPPRTPKRPGQGVGRHHRAPWAPGDKHDVFGPSKSKSKSKKSTLKKMPRNPSGLSKTLTRTHRFCTNNGALLTLATTPLNDSYVVKANSIIEPVGADAGARNTPDGDTSHDALLFNQFAAIYNLITVRRCRIRVDFYNADHLANITGNTSDGMVVGIALLDNSTLLTVPGHYQELADTKWRGLGPEQTATMTHSVDVGKWFGVPKVMSDDTLRMVSTAGTGDIVDNTPSQPLFWHIFAHASRRLGAVDADDIVIDLCITCDYDVTWSEPKAIAQS